MARRYALTARQFAPGEDLLPARGKRGGRWSDHHPTLKRHLSGGCLPVPSGARCPGVAAKWQRILCALQLPARRRHFGQDHKTLGRLHLRLSQEGRLDHALWSIDAPSLRASRSGGRGGEKNRPHDPAGQALEPLAWGLGHPPKFTA